MREALQEREGKRGRFTGTVKRFGKKPAIRSNSPYRGTRDDDAPLVSVDYKLSNGTQFKKVGSMPVDVVGLPLFQGIQ